MTGMEIAMTVAPTIREAAERVKNEVLRNLLDNAAFAAAPMIFLDSNPPRKSWQKSQHWSPAFDAYDVWHQYEHEPEVALADALEQAQRAPKLTVALANKLMRDAHKRGDALAFNAAREALRSL